MKQLPNNFTTPEQSKRLLELGLPADSADCYFYEWDVNDTELHSKGGMPRIFDWFERDIKEFEKRTSVEKYPCWSVGQLIWIYVHLSSYEHVTLIFKKTYTPMAKILEYIEKDIANGILDFSKLKK